MQLWQQKRDDIYIYDKTTKNEILISTKSHVYLQIENVIISA